MINFIDQSAPGIEFSEHVSLPTVSGGIEFVDQSAPGIIFVASGENAAQIDSVTNQIADGGSITLSSVSIDLTTITSLTIAGVNQFAAITTQTANSLVFDFTRGDIPNGTAQIIIGDGVDTWSIGTVVIPVSGKSHVVYAGPVDANALSFEDDGGNSLVLAAGMQLEHDSVAVINNQGVLTQYTGAMPAVIDVQVWTAAEGWGVVRSVSLNESLQSDTTPDLFNIGGPITGANLNAVYAANSFIVSGADSGVDLDITVTNGEYQIDGGVWTASAGVVQNGQTVGFRVTSSSEYLTAVTGTLNIGTVSASFYVITRAQSTVIPGIAFFVRDRNTGLLITDATIDLKISTASFGGIELHSVIGHEIDSSGFITLPMPAGDIGLQVFVLGFLPDGKHIVGNTGILDLNGAAP